MKKFILLICIVFFLFSYESPNINIYVSPKGEDTANGDINHPVATLKQASILARQSARKIAVNIFLYGGYYRLKEPLVLKTEDGGAKDAPVTWQAMPEEKPIVSGGVIIKNWKKENNGLWSASFPSDFKGDFRSFYVNDKRATRARFPDQDFLKVNRAGEDNRTNFFFNKGEIPKVKKVADLELVFMHDWSITRIGVKTIDWNKDHLIAVDSIGSRLPFFKIDNWGKHPRYYLENAIEFCDSPGEWYFNKKEKKLYYYPHADEKLDAFEGTIPIANKLITIKGSIDKPVKYINFKGIIFEHSNWNLPSKGYCGIQACMYTDRSNNTVGWAQLPAAIEMDYAQNCGIYNSTIRHAGSSGIWIRENCSDNTVANSHIYDIAGNGVNIGEGSNRLVNDLAWWKSVPEQVTKNTVIKNSLIEDCGKQFYGAVGIWGGLVANTTIDHNEIRNLPYTGVSIGWMWNDTPTPCQENTIHANHIHHIMNKLSDGGGVYCLGVQPNSKITNNLIHDVKVNAGRAESNGMFLDEGIKNLLVADNIVYNIARSPLRFHKAFENTVRNNVFACGDDIPPIRYNRTKEEDIIKINNVVLKESSKSDMDTLRLLIEKRKNNIGLLMNSK